VAGRLSVQVNGMTEVALTHLDIFDGFKSIKVCTSYRMNGESVTSFPTRIELLQKCEPVYEEFPGWDECTEEIGDFSLLPPNAQEYIRTISRLLGCPVSLLSIGPKREQMIEIRP